MRKYFNSFSVFLVFIFIFLTKSDLIDENFKCECSIILGNQTTLLDLTNNLAKLINADGKIDQKRECEKNCRDSISHLLNYKELENMERLNFNLNNIPNASNNLCQYTDDRIVNPGTTVMLRISLTSSSLEQYFLKDIYLGKLCCNRPCTCQIKAKNSLRSNEAHSVFHDFSNDLSSAKNIGYKCGEEIELCEMECRKLAANFLNYKELIKNRLDYNEINIFENERETGNLMCEKFKSNLASPGLDFYIRIQTNQNDTTKSSIRTISLGKLCCEPKWDCQIVYTNNTYENRWSMEIFNLNNYLPKSADLYYKCNEQVLISNRDCRQAASVFFKEKKFQNMSVPLTSLDILANFQIGVDVCQEIDKVVEEPGVNIYLRYSPTDRNEFAIAEDLHIGRLCCYQHQHALLPKNKCNTLTIPG